MLTSNDYKKMLVLMNRVQVAGTEAEDFVSLKYRIMQAEQEAHAAENPQPAEPTGD